LNSAIGDNLPKVGPNKLVVEVLRDGKNGPEVIARRETTNLVVNSGKQQIWRMVAGLQTNLFDQFRLGTSAAAANSAHTNVLSPVASSIRTADQMTMDVGRTMKWVVSYPSGGGSLSASGIVEVVLLNQHTSPGGSCMMRAIITPVNKTSIDKIRISYNARLS